MVTAQTSLATIDAGRFVVSSVLFHALVTHARSTEPEECCGIGIGPVGSVAEFHPLANVHEQPVTRYEIASSDQLHLHLRAEDNEWETTLVFHSHPATEPYPSATDLSLAGWPDAIYAIMGLAGDEPELRAFRLRDGQVEELAVVVEPAAD